jgi:hypothetical protein
VVRVAVRARGDFFNIFGFLRGWMIGLLCNMALIGLMQKPNNVLKSFFLSPCIRLLSYLM